MIIVVSLLNHGDGVCLVTNEIAQTGVGCFKLRVLNQQNTLPLPNYFIELFDFLKGNYTKLRLVCTTNPYRFLPKMYMIL